MSRPLTSAMSAALAAKIKALAFFMEAAFASGTVRCWTGLGNIEWNGQTWFGSGNVIKIDTVPEAVDVMAQQVVITVGGVDPSVLGAVLEEGGHNLKGTLWLAALDETGAILADPVKLHVGLLDQCQIVETASGPTIQLIYQNRLADLERPRLFNYTDADQQRLSPGDLGFQFVPQVQDFAAKWGSM